MDAAVKRIASQARCYQRRRPEKTLWYHTVQTHLETWLALSTGQGDESPPAYIEQAFRRYLDCGILANGFARAHCDECGHDFLIVFSCKGRGVCPICHAQMQIIAFIDDASTVRKILDHIGESTQPPRIAPARGPPLWEAASATEQACNDPQWDMSAQPVPEFEFDQRIAW